MAALRGHRAKTESSGRTPLDTILAQGYPQYFMGCRI
jgi:hypothetical protein